MPTVPRRDPATTVDLQALPQPQVSSNATEETFGGGASGAAVTAASKGLADAALKVAIKSRDDADKTLAQEFDIRALGMKNEILSEINKNYKGSKAIEAQDYYNKSWGDFVQGQKKIVPNDRIGKMMDTKYSSYYFQIDNHGRSHAANEMEKYSAETYKAHKDTLIEDAAQNYDKPEEFQDTVDAIRADIEKEMTRLGVPKGSPIYDSEEADAMSKIHKLTIERMLANASAAESNADKKAIEAQAKAYAKAHSKEMLGPDGAKMEQYVDAKIEQAEADRKKLVEQKQTTQFHNNLISMNNRQFGLTDAALQLQTIDPETGEPMLSDSDFLRLEARAINTKYQDRIDIENFGQPGDEDYPISVQDAYTKVRNAIDTRTINGRFASPRELTYMVDYYSRGSNVLLSEADRNILLNKISAAPPTENELNIVAQGEYIRDQLANFSKGNEKQKVARAAESQERFLKTVDSEQLSGEEVTARAERFLEQEMVREYPDLQKNISKGLAHMRVSIKSGVKKMMDPTYKSKLKAAYKIVPNTVQETKPKTEKK